MNKSYTNTSNYENSQLKTIKNNQPSTKHKIPWSVEEDKVLTEILYEINLNQNRNYVISANKYLNWNYISSKLYEYCNKNLITANNRNGKQCRERWLYHLSISQKVNLSKEDNEKLFQLVKQKGNKWKEISNIIGYNDYIIKNHYYSSFRKKIRSLRTILIRNNLYNKIVLSEKEIYNIVKSKLSFSDLNEENIINAINKKTEKSEENKNINWNSIIIENIKNTKEHSLVNENIENSQLNNNETSTEISKHYNIEIENIQNTKFNNINLPDSPCKYEDYFNKIDDQFLFTNRKESSFIFLNSLYLKSNSFNLNGNTNNFNFNLNNKISSEQYNFNDKINQFDEFSDDFNNFTSFYNMNNINKYMFKAKLTNEDNSEYYKLQYDNYNY